MSWWVAFAATVCLIASASRLKRALHMLQLDGYRLERYLRHLRERATWAQIAQEAAFVAVAAAGALLGRAGWAGTAWVLALAALAQTARLVWLAWVRPSKLKLAMTARAWRLAALAGALALAAGAALLAAFVRTVPAGPFPPLAAAAAYAGFGGIVFATPAFLVAAALLLSPVESLVRRRFIERARARLAEVGPLVIGVAGSYGKTTTKAALAAALSGRYRVLATPDSYNTLLGVTRTINELLADEHEAFVVEMGARQPGDIAEICDLVHPEVGVVTSLGPQHLEYFKDEATVVRTKTELLRALPADGIAVVDADGIEDFAGAHDWTAPTTRVSAREGAGAEVTVTGVEFTGEGTSFTVRAAGHASLALTTPLLGRHAAADCALAAVAALQLGVEPAAIAAGLAKLRPVPHRLEVVRNDSVVVIDDAFNSNPAGFSAALEVLGAFAGRKILITPGMVELGEETVAAHRRVGEQAARACDVVILVGRTWPAEFMDAILAGGLPAESLHGVASLAAASELLATMIRPGDVVLFENDLPDNFA